MLGKSCRRNIYFIFNNPWKRKRTGIKSFWFGYFHFLVHVIIPTNPSLESRLTNEMFLRDVEIQTDWSMPIEEFYLRLLKLPIQV